jgi:hypothetical protein
MVREKGCEEEGLYVVCFKEKVRAGVEEEVVVKGGGIGR